MASTEKMREHLSPGHQSWAGMHNQKHGIYSMERKGPENLIDPTNITRMSELRAIIRTQPGRDDIRHELAARLTLMVEMGFSSIRERYEGDHVTARQRLKVWKDPVVSMLPRYVSELQRALNNLPVIDDGVLEAELKRIKDTMDEYTEPEDGDDSSS